LNILPLLTAIVAAAFTYMLARQYAERRKFHQLLWTIAMLFYGITAFMEFLMNPDILGASGIAFKVYYILAAPLVGLLGAGVVYLLASKRKADIFLAIIGVLCVALLITGIITPLDEAIIIEAFELPLGKAFHAAVDAYPMTVRRWAIFTNIIGGFALILGAIWSFIKDRRRTYNVLLFLGGVLPMIGGTALAFFGEPSLFFIFELGGVIALFLGFIYSDRFIKARESTIIEAREKRGIE
jgi:hypothetical protein